MATIIFENWPNTCWMDKEWVKDRLETEQKKKIIQIESLFSKASMKRKAQIMGISVGYYYQLRSKYKITTP